MWGCPNDYSITGRGWGSHNIGMTSNIGWGNGGAGTQLTVVKILQWNSLALQSAIKEVSEIAQNRLISNISRTKLLVLTHISNRPIERKTPISHFHSVQTKQRFHNNQLYKTDTKLQQPETDFLVLVLL